MRLVLKKERKKKVFGGVSFRVSAEVKLTKEERDIVNAMKLKQDVLFSKKVTNIWGTPIMDRKLKVTVGDLINGETYKCNDVGEVIAYSDSLKEACETLKTYIEAARTFGGEETYEF